MLADFTDAQFIGNEWASAGLLFGTVISYLLNPAMAGSVSGRCCRRYWPLRS